MPLSLLLIFSLFACDQVSSFEPVRPDNVPVTSVWVGGSDGGVFANINENNGNYFGVIYFDGTGEIWYEGEFEYTGKEPFNVNSKASYSAWDGEKFHLNNGQELASALSD